MNGKLRLANVLALAVMLLGTGSALGQPIADSMFDSGTEGWMVVSTGTPPHFAPPHWSATGGNPGGYIYDTDMDNGGWGFLAPAEFLGPVDAAYGHEFSFDFFTDRIGLDNETAPVVFADVDGIGVITYVDLPEVGVLEHRVLTLHESTEWYTYDVTGQPSAMQDRAGKC